MKATQNEMEENRDTIPLIINPHPGKAAPDIEINGWMKVVIICVLVVLWSQSTVLSVVRMKEILNEITSRNEGFEASKMILISAAQNGVSALISGVFCKLCSRFNITTMGKFNGQYSISRQVEMMAMAHLVASFSMNWFVLMEGGSIALILKLAEPLATMGFSYFILNKLASPYNLFSLLLVTIGIFLVCHETSTEAHPATHHSAMYPVFITMCISGFPLRNVLAKDSPNSGVFLYFTVSLVSSVFLLGLTIVACIYQSFPAQQILDFVMNERFVYMALYYAIYNVLSYVILSFTDAVSHSLLGIVKRFYSIIGSIILLNENSIFSDSTNTIGCVMCLIGLGFYGYLKTVPGADKGLAWSHIFAETKKLHIRLAFLALFIAMMLTSNKVEIFKVETFTGRAVLLKPHDNCGRNGFHITCKTLLEISEDRPMLFEENQRGLCAELFANHSIHMNANPIPEEVVNGNAIVDLCVQQGSKTAAVKSPGNLFIPSEQVIRDIEVSHKVLKRIHLKTVYSRKLYFNAVNFVPGANAICEHDFIALRAGGNTGNSLWEYGSMNMLHPHTTLFVGADNIAPYDKSYDAILLASANPLQSNGTQDHHLSSLLQSIRVAEASSMKNLPLVLFGIGIQGQFGDRLNSTEYIDSYVVSQMQKFFWEELNKRGRHNVPNVAVRGKITSIVCQKAGDSHCLPLGCPSYMINPQINLGVHVGFLWDRLLNRMRDGKDSEVAKIYFNLPGSIDSRNPEFLHLPALLTYLAQHPQYELTFVYQTCEDKAWVNAWGKDNSIKSTQYQVKFFSEAPAWFNELESADLVLGYRIHGTMAAVAAGVPFFLFPTDFRVLEMAEAMNIPHWGSHELASYLASNEVDRLMEGPFNFLSMIEMLRKKFDEKAFDTKRTISARTYRDMLVSIDLEPNPHVVAMAGKG